MYFLYFPWTLSDYDAYLASKRRARIAPCSSVVGRRGRLYVKTHHDREVCNASKELAYLSRVTLKSPMWAGGDGMSQKAGLRTYNRT
jgi:hypothetical protein